MKYEIEKVETSDSTMRFEFYSSGPKGRICKQITFQRFENNPEVFNLGFGDKESNDTIDDKVVSDNHDTKKVLMTVASSIEVFYRSHPDKWVLAIGSTSSRTRLYRIALANEFVKIKVNYHLFGLLNGVWEPFEMDHDYEAFLLKKKSNILF